MRTKPALEGIFPVVIVGLPGSGKTTVSRELARLLGVCEVDTDSEIKRRTRQSIPDIFAAQGESGFRKIEHAAVAHALEISGGVVALGGGAILHPETRRLLENMVVLYLRTTPEEAARRVGDGKSRPLISAAEDGLAQMRQLAARRIPLYESVATLAVDTDGIDPQTVAQRAYEALRNYAARLGVRDVEKTTPPTPIKRIHVLAERPYDVVLGRGILSEISDAVNSDTKRILLTYPNTLPAHSVQCLLSKEYEVVPFELPEGEAAKTAQTMSKGWEVLGANLFGRKDTVVAVGGGATTDSSGFLAATWLRGIDVIQVPTTVLAMVDAAVGGKTGINTRHGKNLVGAFHTPTAVVCDLDFLKTLPREQFVAGMGEVIKCGFISDPQILALVQQNPTEHILDPQSQVLAELMERAIRVKAKIVSADLRESGQREFLNYGHTFAHAIEKVENYRFAHGKAVAIGCVFAAVVAQKLGIASAQLVEKHRQLFSKVGLPISYQGDPSQLLSAMRSDKKVRSDAIRMVLVSDTHQVSVQVISDPSLLVAAMSEVAK